MVNLKQLTSSLKRPMNVLSSNNPVKVNTGKITKPRQILSNTHPLVSDMPKTKPAIDKPSGRVMMNSEEKVLRQRMDERYTNELHDARVRSRDRAYSQYQASNNKVPNDTGQKRTFKKAVLYGTGTLAAGAGVVAGVAYGAYNAIYPQGRDEGRDERRY